MKLLRALGILSDLFGTGMRKESLSVFSLFESVLRVCFVITSSHQCHSHFRIVHCFLWHLPNEHLGMTHTEIFEERWRDGEGD